ncbi:MAG: hypothetical protein H7837_09335 [Magnetococcus sp. MYC-9]
MITTIGPTAATRDTAYTTPRNDDPSSPAERPDVVEISQAARALLAGQRTVSQPAALLTHAQLQVKMGLLRTFLETLFGRQETEQESPEQEVAGAVLEKPLTEQAMQTLRDNGWLA